MDSGCEGSSAREARCAVARHALVLVAALAAAGCIRAPAIVVIDRATALEREAAGSFPQLERELERAGTVARPAALTREQLDASGNLRPVVEEAEGSDAERVDALLKQSCVGEALDGTLAETRERCAVKEVPHLGSLLDRTNRNRMQVWEWLRGQRPGRSLGEVRKAWREVHLRGVPCGAEVQGDDGAWGGKRC
jgi:hypothetical protein